MKDEKDFTLLEEQTDICNCIVAFATEKCLDKLIINPNCQLNCFLTETFMKILF